MFRCSAAKLRGLSWRAIVIGVAIHFAVHELPIIGALWFAHAHAH